MTRSPFVTARCMWAPTDQASPGRLYAEGVRGPAARGRPPLLPVRPHFPAASRRHAADICRIEGTATRPGGSFRSVRPAHPTQGARLKGGLWTTYWPQLTLPARTTPPTRNGSGCSWMPTRSTRCQTASRGTSGASGKGRFFCYCPPDRMLFDLAASALHLQGGRRSPTVSNARLGERGPYVPTHAAQRRQPHHDVSDVVFLRTRRA